MAALYKVLIFPAAIAALFGVLNLFDNKGSFIASVFLIAPFAAITFLLFAQVKADKNDFFKKVEKFGPSKYGEHINNTGIAVTTNGKIVLANGLKVKAYDFGDVRQWGTSIQDAGMVLGGGINGVIINGVEGKRAAANSGLFISVRDIENPEWHVKFRDKSILNKWYEILQQEINER